ncbi:MAG: tRNA 2-thiouridine(34) synthase MnmA [Clostridia bacterium]
MLKKVVVGMSGGVDSSVTALLLKKEGYDVIGITMNLWESESENTCDKACCNIDAVNDARAVAKKLDIPYYVYNFREVFEKKVIDYFANEYMNGKTPNPCIACNRYVKFEALLDKAISIGADYIATGHYAKVDFNKETGRYFLRKSVTIEKDQTYALYTLTQNQLSHILMPLGSYNKPEVRKIAEEANLINAKKSESQEICFVEDNNYSRFIKENYNYVPKKGKFISKEGKVLGEHQGIINYTIGQRKGLGITFGKPMYVTGVDVEQNTVKLGEEKDLYTESLICTNLNFMPFEKLIKPIIVTAKIRYSAKEAVATIYPLENGNVKVSFAEAQKSVTPGQAIVFYDEDILVGGGTII